MGTIERIVVVNRFDGYVFLNKEMLHWWMISRIADLIVEMVGSFFVGFVLFSVTSITSNTMLLPWTSVPVLGIMMCAMYTSFGLTGRFGMADFNSTNTAALAMLGYRPLLQALLMMIGQFNGFILAALAAQFVLPSGIDLVANIPTVPLSVGSHKIAKLVLTEFILSYCLSTVVVLVVRHNWKAKNRFVDVVGALALGATTTALNTTAMFIGTGSSLNFTKTLALALITAKYDALGYYALATFSGAAMTAFMVSVFDRIYMDIHSVHKLQVATVAYIDDENSDSSVTAYLRAFAVNNPIYVEQSFPPTAPFVQQEIVDYNESSTSITASPLNMETSGEAVFRRRPPP